MRTEYGAEYADLYAHHWWWRARESILVREIKVLSLPSAARILDVGCGDGLFFPTLSRWGAVSGIEIDQNLVSPQVHEQYRVFHDPLGSPVYRGMRFDLITALDVVEHIEDDVRALRDIVSMIAPLGYLVLTMPAFPALWDEHDERNHHFRRYRLRRVRELLSNHGHIVRLRYLFPSLFLPKLLVGSVNRVRQAKIPQAKVPSPGVTSVVARLLSIEDRIASRVPVPFGTSVFAVLRRSS